MELHIASPTGLPPELAPLFFGGGFFVFFAPTRGKQVDVLWNFPPCRLGLGRLEVQSAVVSGANSGPSQKLDPSTCELLNM